MKTNFFDIALALRLARRANFSRQPFKKKQMFINSNTSFQRMILTVVCPVRRALFPAPTRGEYEDATPNRP